VLHFFNGKNIFDFFLPYKLLVMGAKRNLDDNPIQPRILGMPLGTIHEPHGFSPQLHHWALPVIKHKAKVIIT
jgi:hypothetical protein